VEQGAKLLIGGKETDEKRSNYLENTAFLDVGEEHLIMKKEIFGPIAVSLRNCFVLSLVSNKHGEKFEADVLYIPSR